MARSTTRTQETTSQANASMVYVQSDANVSFPDGVMYVGGLAQIPTRSAQWKSSNGISVYTAVTWRNPITGEQRTSCNCPGWWSSIRRGKRHCCHTKDMEGIAACNKERASEQAITTVQDVAAFIPSVTNTKELRGIMLD